jgi:UDP-glucose 4-epimerase
LAQERLLAHSLDWTTPVSLRLSNVYGPGQRTSAGYGVVGHWMEAMRAGQPVTILGSPAARRDYLHVSDAVAALLAVRSRFARLRLSAAPVVLNVGSGVPTSLAELHLLLEDVVGGPIRVSHRPARAFDRRDTWLDVTRVTAVLDWAPAMSLTDGLADTWHSHAGSKLATSGQVRGRT